MRERRPGLPVIVFTARGEVRDRVSGLDAGAIDYVVKPFALAELIARVQTHLRSAQRVTWAQLRSGDIEIDLLSRAVRRAGERVYLSSTEFDLLVFLVDCPRAVTRTEILRAVWGYEHDVRTNIVDVYVGYLRRKLRQGRAAGPTRGRCARSATGSTMSPSAPELRPRGARRRALRWLGPASLRWRLTAWVAAVMLASAAVACVVVYRDTGRQLRGQIQHDLRGDAAQLSQSLDVSGARTPLRVAAVAGRYLQGQPYDAAATLLVVVVPRRRALSNHPELIGSVVPDDGETPTEQRQEDRLSGALLSPRTGYFTLQLPDIGAVRLLERTVVVGGTSGHGSSSASHWPLSRGPIAE